LHLTPLALDSGRRLLWWFTDIGCLLLSSASLQLCCSLYSSAHLNPDVPSRNILCEVRGRELPDELVILGAHLDSWDVGQGAHDDGQGCMVAVDVLRVLLALGLRPRRTIRVVLFTDEEVRSSGAESYHAAHSRPPASDGRVATRREGSCRR
jgi:acetylornithine deacetylase/succinyl-diaminopimelate desuccinylase-like protein